MTAGGRTVRNQFWQSGSPARRRGDHHIEEATMFEATTLAVNNLKTYLEQNKISSAIRVALMQGG